MRTRTKTLVFAITSALIASGAAFAQVKGPDTGKQPAGPSNGSFLIAISGETCAGNGGSNCSVDIPDSGGGPVASSFEINSCGLVADVDLGIDATHTWVGDLVFTLTSPAGTPVVAYDRPGVPVTTFGCSGDDIAAMLDDDAAAPVEDECGAATPTIDGIFSPNNPLAAINGEPGNGTWTLQVEDFAGGDIGTLNDWSLELTCVAADQANFKVTKTFSDGSDSEVDVMLSCNTGLPLEQTFTIAGGDPDGVTFVVTDIPDSGATCEVTESGVPDGYTAVLNGGAGCAWDDVLLGDGYTCEITNIADDATYTVLKNWEFNSDGGDVVIAEANVTIECDSEIDGGSEFDGAWFLSDTLGDGDTLVAMVDVTDGPATCSASEMILESGVESSSVDCGNTQLTAGGSHVCTFTNTVFFEGIPTLGQYGLAILVLLTLGVGFIGFRRYA